MAFPKTHSIMFQENPKSTRQDIDIAVTRHFCENCGTAIEPKALLARFNDCEVGTMDDPSAFKPQAAIFT